MNDKSLVQVQDLTGFSAPLTKLIEKLSEAVGGLFLPFQMKRIAKAKVKVKEIKAEGEIVNWERKYNEIHCLIPGLAVDQHNFKQILLKANPLIDKNSDPNGINNDWLRFYYDKAKLCSDADLQDQWAKILAGEANEPGKYSKRLINLLSYIGTDEAEIFNNIIGFSCTFDNITAPFIYKIDDPIYTTKWITFQSLIEIVSLGLIEFTEQSNQQEYHYHFDYDKVEIAYYGNTIELETQKLGGENIIKTGQILLTALGSELATVCNPPKVPGFWEYLIENWKRLEYLN